MKRGRGRPPVYTDATQQPVLMALRIPRALETRLRQEAAEQGRSMTDILLQALVAQWEHPQAAAELAETQAALVETQAQLSTLKRQYATLERRSARLTKQRRTQAAADKKERTRLAEELEVAEGLVRRLHMEMSVFTAANPDLAEENARRYAKVQDEAHRRHLAELEDMCHTMAGLTGRAAGKIDPAFRRELQRDFHPDHWSQGQLAKDLADELFKRLNR
jgi:hypothetical protein